MTKKIYWDILDTKRKKILPILKEFKDEFYLAGGTALALQFGHRDSIDFDFFSEQPFSTEKLFQKIVNAFWGYKIKKVQEEENTLSVIVNSKIKISFFHYRYKLVKSIIKTENLNIADLVDVGCMKLSAIVSRATMKDYIDLYFILQEISLPDLTEFAKKKFPDLDTNLILKSLVYFDDIEIEPIIFKHGNKVTLPIIKSFLESEVKKYYND